MLNTSCDDEHDVVESRRLEAGNIVRKPVAYHDFAHIVQTLSAYRLAIGESHPTPEGTS